jgi:hypothetical protein
MRLPDVKSAMYTAYLLGFESSREGVNGEHGRRPASWYENRDQQISEYLENHRPEEPAFPVPETVCDGRAFQPDNQGMSLRDYFAAKALAGVIDPMSSADLIARYCYAVADAMMKAREA